MPVFIPEKDTLMPNPYEIKFKELRKAEKKAKWTEFLWWFCVLGGALGLSIYIPTQMLNAPLLEKILAILTVLMIWFSFFVMTFPAMIVQYITASLERKVRKYHKFKENTIPLTNDESFLKEKEYWDNFELKSSLCVWLLWEIRDKEA